MKSRVTAVLLLLGMFFMLASSAFAQNEISISDHYGVSPEVALAYYNQLGSWWAVDRALYISDQTGASPESIIHLRLDGESFPEIAAQYGMTAGTYYTPFGASLVIEAGIVPHHYLGYHWWPGHYRRVVIREYTFHHYEYPG